MDMHEGRQKVTIDKDGWMWHGWPCSWIAEEERDKHRDEIGDSRTLIGMTIEKLHRIRGLDGDVFLCLVSKENRMKGRNESAPSLSPTPPSKEKLAETIKDRTVILGDDGWIRKMNDQGEWRLWGVSLERIREIQSDHLYECEGRGCPLLDEAERKEEAYAEETEDASRREGGGDPRDDGSGDQGPGESGGGAPEAKEVQAAPACEEEGEEGLVDRGLTRTELAGKFNELVDFFREAGEPKSAELVVLLSGHVMTAVMKRDQALRKMTAELEKAKEVQGKPVMATYTEEEVADRGETKAEKAAFRGPDAPYPGRSWVLGPPGQFEKISMCRMPIASGEIRIKKIQGFDGFETLGPPFFEVNINGLKLGPKRDMETFIQAASFLKRWMEMERKAHENEEVHSEGAEEDPGGEQLG